MSARHGGGQNVIDHNQLSRREFVALAGAGLVAASRVAPAQSPQRVFAYVGSWTQGPFGVGGGGGIGVFSVDVNDGSLEPVSRTGPEFDNMNAGYLCISGDGRFLYATNEVGNLNGENGAGGGILSFAIDPDDGSIAHMNTQPCWSGSAASTRFRSSTRTRIRSTSTRATGSYLFATRVRTGFTCSEWTWRQARCRSRGSSRRRRDRRHGIPCFIQDCRTLSSFKSVSRACPR